MIAYALGFCFDFKTVFEYDIEYSSIWTDYSILSSCDERTRKKLKFISVKLKIDCHCERGTSVTIS